MREVMCAFVLGGIVGWAATVLALRFSRWLAERARGWSED